MRKSGGQSLVEVAIAFPVLIMLFSGMVEFGFILNYYLSLLDATRDAARLYSGGDPFVWNPNTTENPYGSDEFYHFTAAMAEEVLDPSIQNPTYKGRRIALDPALDDVIVSVYSAEYTASGNSVTNRRTGGPYHLINNGRYQSIFSEETVLDTRVCGAPNEGLLIVEIHYNYHHVLGLPWMKAILPNPLHLQAYSIMPIRAAETVPPIPAPAAPVCP